MNKNNLEYGFTLVEVIVSINLFFMVLTLFVGTYLFFFKFQNNIEKKLIYDSALYYLMNSVEKKFDISENYTVRLDLNKFEIRDNKFNYLQVTKDSIITKFNKIKIDSCSILVTNNNYNTFRFMNFQKYGVNSHLLRSSDLKLIEYKFWHDQKVYEFSYYPLPISSQRFRNLL